MRVLLAVISLLTFAASAQAEGVWVLWGQTMDPWGALARFPLGHWPSRQACETERAKREQGLAELQLVSYSCVSDTVDPPGLNGT